MTGEDKVTNLLLLLVCLLAGMELRRSGRIGAQGHLALNAVIVDIALPAVALRSLHAMLFDPSQVWPLLMPWLLFSLGVVVFAALGRRLALSQASIGALILVCGLGNRSFVGLPMIESLRGRGGPALGLLNDRFGSYPVLSTICIFSVTLYATQARPTPRAMAMAMAMATLSFPPLIGVAVALALRPVSFPSEHGALARLSDRLAPLALLSVGLQRRLDALREQRTAGVMATLSIIRAPTLAWVSCVQGGRRRRRRFSDRFERPPQRTEEGAAMLVGWGERC
jgi:predicted permease